MTILPATLAEHHPPAGTTGDASPNPGPDWSALTSTATPDLADVFRRLAELKLAPRWSSDRRQISCRCPVHGDSTASATVTVSDDRLLAVCFVCNRGSWFRRFLRVLDGTDPVVRPTGAPKAVSESPHSHEPAGSGVMSRSSFLFETVSEPGIVAARRLVEHRADGTRSLTWWTAVPYPAGRHLDPETHEWAEHPAGRTWRAGLAPGLGDRLALWPWLSTLISRARTQRRLLICEGESDTKAAVDMGAAAVTSGGSGSFARRHAEQIWLAGIQPEWIMIVADFDDAGAHDAVHRLDVLAEPGIRTFRPSVPGQDLRDLLQCGGTLDDLEQVRITLPGGSR